MIQLSLILPVHNEADIIRSVSKTIYKTLDSLSISYEIIFVENGSTDNSLFVIKDIVKKHTSSYAITSEKGYGSAVRAGLKKARGKYVCYMPSDGQVDLSVIAKLWSLANAKTFELVKVKRPSRENSIRLMTSLFFSSIISILFHTPFIDINGSPRIFLRSALPVLSLVSSDSFIDAEFLIKATQLGWKIKELPMKHMNRLGGKSTRSYKTYIEFLQNIYTYKTSSIIAKWKNQL